MRWRNSDKRLKQKLNWLPDYPLIKGISARMRGLKNGRERCGEAQFEAMIFTGTKLKGAFIVDPELKPDDRFSFPDLVQAGGVALLASR